MSRIRAHDTGPEMILRRALHRAGVRYRLHDRALPGTPDLVMRPRRAVAFVHGCFWHAHDCPKGTKPATRADFWDAKLDKNRERDSEDVAALLRAGWRVATIWECALTGRAKREPDEVARAVRDWLARDETSLSLSGSWTPPAAASAAARD